MPGNLLVIANAGTGKTHTLVNKIEFDLTNRRDFRKVGAITFTIKAANEIKNRINFDLSGSFVGTTHGFVMQEIIIPFFDDVFKVTSDVELYATYDLLVDSFEEGIEKIRTFGKIGVYSRNYIKENPNHQNFMFELACLILEKSDAARKYLCAKYFKIYVDEYQDCDETMHIFFMYLANQLNIDLFLVGDNKQSIYQWRGADPAVFEKIKTEGAFSVEFLHENFRSTKAIQNFSNVLFKETSDLYVPTEVGDGVVLLQCTPENWVDRVSKYLDNQKSTAILRYSRKNIQLDVNSLNQKGFNFQYIPPAPVDNISSKDRWIYNIIAKYVLVPRYSVYDFVSEIPGGLNSGITIQQLKKRLQKVLLGKNDKSNCKQGVTELINMFGIVGNDSDYNLLFDTVSDDAYQNTFNQEEFLHVGMTFFGAKGLQFNQVILFTSDYNITVKEEEYNHYVATTRAEKKLILVEVREKSRYVQSINDRLKLYNLKWDDVALIDPM